MLLLLYSYLRLYYSFAPAVTHLNVFLAPDAQSCVNNQTKLDGNNQKTGFQLDPSKRCLVQYHVR